MKGSSRGCAFVISLFAGILQTVKSQGLDQDCTSASNCVVGYDGLQCSTSYYCSPGYSCYQYVYNGEAQGTCKATGGTSCFNSNDCYPGSSCFQFTCLQDAGQNCNSGSQCLSGSCTGTCNIGGPGAACTTGTDCASRSCLNSVCKSTSFGQGCSTNTDCVINGQAGASDDVCINGYCVLPARSQCSSNSDCASGNCQGAGGSFGAGSGLCAPGNIGSGCLQNSDCAQGVCTNEQCTYVPLGTSCTANSQCGNTGDYLYICEGTCIANVGGTCSSQGQCISGSNCYGSTCSYYTAPGNACNPLANPNACASPTTCMTATGGGQNVCSRLSSGGVCTGDGQCLGGACSGGRCASNQGSATYGNVYCNSDSDCSNGGYCDTMNYECSAPQTTGSSCTSNIQCANNQCNGGICACDDASDFYDTSTNSCVSCGLGTGNSQNGCTCNPSAYQADPGKSPVCVAGTQTSGESCTSNGQCANNQCLSAGVCGCGSSGYYDVNTGSCETCGAGISDGQNGCTCNASAYQADPSKSPVCVAGTQTSGESCTANGQCANNQCLSAGVCGCGSSGYYDVTTSSCVSCGAGFSVGPSSCECFIGAQPDPSNSQACSCQGGLVHIGNLCLCENTSDFYDLLTQSCVSCGAGTSYRDQDGCSCYTNAYNPDPYGEVCACPEGTSIVGDICACDNSSDFYDVNTSSCVSCGAGTGNSQNGCTCFAQAYQPDPSSSPACACPNYSSIVSSTCQCDGTRIYSPPLGDGPGSCNLMPTGNGNINLRQRRAAAQRIQAMQKSERKPSRELVQLREKRKVVTPAWA